MLVASGNPICNLSKKTDLIQLNCSFQMLSEQYMAYVELENLFFTKSEQVTLLVKITTQEALTNDVQENRIIIKS